VLARSFAPGGRGKDQAHAFASAFGGGKKLQKKRAARKAVPGLREKEEVHFSVLAGGRKKKNQEHRHLQRGKGKKGNSIFHFAEEGEELIEEEGFTTIPWAVLKRKG